MIDLTKLKALELPTEESKSSEKSRKPLFVLFHNIFRSKLQRCMR